MTSKRKLHRVTITFDVMAVDAPVAIKVAEDAINSGANETLREAVGRYQISAVAVGATALLRRPR